MLCRKREKKQLLQLGTKGNKNNHNNLTDRQNKVLNDFAHETHDT